jgi:predicted RNA binding protein YcfA (HicA-like mRNA interferase family)
MEKKPYFFSRSSEVKRKDILKKLAAAGFTLQEGGDHTKVYDKSVVFRSVVGRLAEIPERTAKKIEKQTGVKLY